MKITKAFSATMLMAIALLSAPVYATSVQLDSGLLYNNPSLNRKLETGEYDFAAQHSRYGSSFKDRWKFTVAEDSTAALNVNDLETNLGNVDSTKPTSLRYSRRASMRSANAAKATTLRQSRRSPRSAINTAKIFDTKNLTFSLFDYKGNLIGEAGENGILSGLNLVAGKWYTIQVTGDVNGFFGSAYRGVLNINPTPVPLGDTAPLLGSALALLALRLRKRHSRTA